jgi:hypothetical protein
MQTKICKHCKEEIDRRATRCPKYGGKLGAGYFLDAGENLKSGCFLFVLIPFIIFIIFLIGYFASR